MQEVEPCGGFVALDLDLPATKPLQVLFQLIELPERGIVHLIHRSKQADAVLVTRVAREGEREGEAYSAVEQKEGGVARACGPVEQARALDERVVAEAWKEAAIDEQPVGHHDAAGGSWGTSVLSLSQYLTGTCTLSGHIRDGNDNDDNNTN